MQYCIIYDGSFNFTYEPHHSVTAATIAFSLHCSMVHAKESNIEYMSSRPIARSLLFTERLSWDLLGQMTSCTTGATKAMCEFGSSTFYSIDFTLFFKLTKVHLLKKLSANEIRLSLTVHTLHFPYRKWFKILNCSANARISP